MININLPVGNSFMELLKESMMKPRVAELEASAAMATMAKEIADQEAANQNIQPVPPVAQSGSYVMSRNFFDSNHEQSEYVKARVDFFTQERQVANKMSSLVSTLAAQTKIWDLQRTFGDKNHPIENTYVIGQRLNAVSTLATNQVKEKETHESSEENLKKLREEIEQRAKEATAPTDADGNPIVTVGSDGAIEVAPMPEISTGGEAPMPEISTGGGTPVAVAPTAPQTPDVPLIGEGAAVASSYEGVKINITV